MYYEINVALNGSHFFATADRSIDGKQKLKKVLSVIVNKFLLSEGYHISVTYYRKIGHNMDPLKILLYDL